MKEDQLRLLESRINSAITFIENLKSKEKQLLSEEEELRKRILLLEKSIEEKDKRNDDLLKTQKYLKEKIEFILGKLEGLAEVSEESVSGIENGDSPPTRQKSATQPVKGQPVLKERQRAPRAAASGPEAKGGEAAREADGIIIEERVVDLKKENEKNKPKTVMRSGLGGTQSTGIRSGSVSDGYAGDLFSQEEESFGKDRQSGGAAPGWYGDNPFVEI